MRGLIAALGAVVVIAAVPAPGRRSAVRHERRRRLPRHPAAGRRTASPTAVELAAFLTTGAAARRTTTTSSAMYRDLVYATPGLKAAGHRATTTRTRRSASSRATSSAPTRPRADVTILRDNGFGVPHIYGTRAPARCSAPATPPREDRLFFIDVLRHLGRAELSSFIGGAPANRAMDARAVGDRALHRGRPPAPVRPRATTSTATDGAPAPGRRAELRRRRQPVHRRGEARPEQDAGRVRRDRPAAGARRLEGDRHHRHRLAGRRRSSARAAARELEPQSQLLDALDGALRREEGPHAVARLPPRSTTREAPTTVHGQALPLPGHAEARGEGRRGAARPRLVQGPESRARDAPPAGGGLRRRHSRAGRVPGRLPLPRLGALPKAMSNALLVSARKLASRPPARRLRPAGRLLRARRSSWRRTCTGRASTPAAPPSPA